jgi:hypothetical protein
MTWHVGGTVAVFLRLDSGSPCRATRCVRSIWKALKLGCSENTLAKRRSFQSQDRYVCSRFSIPTSSAHRPMPSTCCPPTSGEPSSLGCKVGFLPSCWSMVACRASGAMKSRGAACKSSLSHSFKRLGGCAAALEVERLARFLDVTLDLTWRGRFVTRLRRLH